MPGKVVEPVDGQRNLPKGNRTGNLAFTGDVSLTSFRDALQKALQQEKRGRDQMRNTARSIAHKLALNEIEMNFKLRNLSSCLLVLMALATAHAQRTEKVFEKVPLELRPRLIERLTEYVMYERTRQYEKLYELLYDRNDKNIGKEAYSKARVEAEGRWGIIQEFRPTFILETTLSEGDSPILSITGQAKVCLRGRTVKKEMGIDARFHDGEWYFSELSNVYWHID